MDVVQNQRLITLINQDLSFYLGGGNARQEGPMAVVLQVTRGHFVPPQAGSIQDWFQYTFRSVLREIYGKEWGKPVGAAESGQREYKHNVRQIFRLPGLQFILKTKHSQ